MPAVVIVSKVSQGEQKIEPFFTDRKKNKWQQMERKGISGDSSKIRVGGRGRGDPPRTEETIRRRKKKKKRVSSRYQNRKYRTNWFVSVC